MLKHDFIINKFLKKLIQYNVKNIVISPGSRSTPIVNNILKNKQYFNLKLVLDERSAAFFALGISKYTKYPTVLICTSGTSTLNYSPAVAEAYYSRIPLIVITADRPMEYRGSGINQTLNQSNIYKNNINWFYDVPIATDSPNFISNVAYKSILKSISDNKGPVHINWQLEEPFTDGEIQTIEELDVDDINDLKPKKISNNKNNFLKLVKDKKGIILVGENDNNHLEIIDLAKILNWPIIADPLSNLRQKNNYKNATIVDTGDLIFRTNKFLDIDTVIHIGALPVSKYILNNLLKANSHIFFEESNNINEGLFNIDLHIQDNFKLFIDELKSKNKLNPDNLWKNKFKKINESIRIIIEKMDHDFDEIKFKKILIEKLSAESIFISGNSLSIRILDIILNKSKSVNFVGNRGLSGIDGNIAMASGFSSMVENPVYLDLGDLAFFHDSSSLITSIRNAKNLTIIVNNNQGGQIFSLLSQAKDIKEIYDEWFITSHEKFSIKNISEGFGCKYYNPNNQKEFEEILLSSSKIKGTKVIELNFKNSDYTKFNNYIKDITNNV
ncbi:MAG: 2-succinyl-5-enolpyruvyl-6-hydroxy-3-cyclohexene-1-carboxylic-acid synthase [Dehalococcoidia bacterium]|nr:2-succinyl-5-enolpyruvyl-6-hydroxy-3-cyclohexene-1-carboxylic-acid synthase [Dehalococcoidia bacterium]